MYPNEIHFNWLIVLGVRVYNLSIIKYSVKKELNETFKHLGELS